MEAAPSCALWLLAMLWLSSVQANHNNASCTFGDADHCFADTNLLILGSSTSRHWFFVLREVLNATATRNGAPVDLSRVGFVSLLSPRNRYAKNYRQHEKDLCGGGKLAWSGIDAVKTSLPLMPTGPRCSTFVKKTRTLLTFVWHLPFRREEARALGRPAKWSWRTRGRTSSRRAASSSTGAGSRSTCGIGSPWLRPSTTRSDVVAALRPCSTPLLRHVENGDESLLREALEAPRRPAPAPAGLERQQHQQRERARLPQPRRH